MGGCEQLGPGCSSAGNGPPGLLPAAKEARFEAFLAMAQRSVVAPCIMSGCSTCTRHPSVSTSEKRWQDVPASAPPPAGLSLRSSAFPAECFWER